MPTSPAADASTRVTSTSHARMAFTASFAAKLEGGAVLYHEAHGHFASHEDGPERFRGASRAAVYDLASLTKVLATTTLAAIAVGEGRALLTSEVPAPWSTACPGATLQHLLAHDAGLVAHREYFAALGRRGPAQRVLEKICLTPPAGPPAIPVTTDPAQVGPVPVQVIANGTVQSESVVTIRPRVDGQITQLHVAEGQSVRRGQLLFNLDARLNLALVQQQEAQLLRDRAQATRTQLDAVRYQSLRGESFASQQRFEQAQADAAAAAATVQATQALIIQTRLSIEFAAITAEVDGQLGALPLRVGNFVRQAENVSMGTITQTNPILVQFNVPERWLPVIRTAMRGARPPYVMVQPDGDTGPPTRGTLVFVDSQVDTATGTIMLKARFDNADQRLLPGQYVQVRTVPTVQENAISIASAAVQTGQQGRFIFVLVEGVARRRAVILERSLGDRAIVRGEIAQGERVIVDGAQRVTDGARVVDRSAPSPRVSALETPR